MFVYVVILHINNVQRLLLVFCDNNCFAKYEWETYGALVVTLAMLWRLINCRIIIKHVYRRRYESRRSSKPKLH